MRQDLNVFDFTLNDEDLKIMLGLGTLWPSILMVGGLGIPPRGRPFPLDNGADPTRGIRERR
jgi:hypothetical protein